MFRGIRVLILCLLAGLLQSCALWPYERDFGCPIKEGLKCKTLYEISQLADQGYFAPGADKEKICPGCKQPQSQKKRRGRG